MAKKQSWLKKLSRLYRSGPKSRAGSKSVRGQDTTAAVARNGELTVMQKSQSPSFANATANAYSMTERLLRYQDYCEMESTPELATALDIYADETVACDEKEQIFHIFSPNEAIKVALEDLFYGVLNVEFNLRGWVRNLAKYGDFFLYHEIDAERGVYRATPLPVNEVEREEGYDASDPTLYRFRMQSLGNRVLDCWEVSHMRLLGNDQFLPYGMSVIEAARRIWRQLILMEDAMLTYRIVRAPERRVFYVDVGNTPPEEVPLVVEDVKRNIRSATVVDRTTGRTDLRYNPVSIEEDYWVAVRGTETGTKIETLQGGQNAAATEDVQYIQKKLFAAVKIPRAFLGYDESLSCIVPETPVDLLDGRTLTLTEVRSELDAGKSVWVYSVDQETLEMKPGRVVWCGPTRKNAELVRITLDNGMSFDTTPDHKWMLRDGAWCQAADLVAGDSLMPLYTRRVSMRGGADYEQVFDPASGTYVYTHRLVAERVDGGIAVHEQSRDEKRDTIHHVDCDRFNNAPENLLKIGWSAHRKLHQDMLAQVKKRALAEGKYSGLNNGYAKKCREAVAHLWSMQKLIDFALSEKPKSKRELLAYGLTETQLHKLLDENSVTYAEFADRYMDGYKLARAGRTGFSYQEYERKNGYGPGARGAKFEVRACVACNSEFEMNVKIAKKFCSASCRSRFGKGKTAPEARVVRQGRLNHVVVSVERLAERRDTWCMEVAETHTFALSKSVIISNSKATLAQEDVRFSRSIAVMQKTVIAELTRLAVIHLFCLGFPDEELTDFSLKLSNPSTIAQQQKLELLRARAEIAGAFPEGMVDKKWLRREVLNLTDEHAAEIDENRLRERQIDAKIEAAGEAPEGGEGGGGGGGSLFGGDGGGDSGGPPGDLGGASDDPLAAAADSAAPSDAGDDAGADIDAADDAADDEDRDEDIALLTSADDPGAEGRDRAKRRSKRKRRHGPEAMSQPDLAGALASSADDDPFDSHWLAQAGRNPLAETPIRAVRLSPDMRRTLTMAHASMRAASPRLIAS